MDELEVPTDSAGNVTFYARGAEDEGGQPFILTCQGALKIVTIHTNMSLAAPEVTNFSVDYPGGAARPTLHWDYTPPGAPVSIEVFSSVDGENWIRRAGLPSSARTWSEPILFGASYVNYRVYTVWND
jgi:hypothetical protein